jgi:lipoyl(octanoyl) transferase
MITEALTSSQFGACDTEGTLRRVDGGGVEWIISDGPVPYPEALVAMRARTAGTSAERKDLLEPDRFPVYDAGRGGEYTYHGPGQRVAYIMLDLRERGRDVRCLVRGLEGWLIDTVGAFNIKGERRDGRIGVWVKRPEKGWNREDKIAAIGVRVSRWVTFHGIALNVSPDLNHFGGIVPCGITDQGVTSFEDLGQLATLPEVDSVLRAAFEHRFGITAASTSQTLVSAA